MPSGRRETCAARPRPGGAPRRARGLTLTELLVVLAILSMVAGMVMANAGGIAGRSRLREAQAVLDASWRLARAHALARHRPVLWRLREAGPAVVVELRPVTGGEPLWAHALDHVSVDACDGATARPPKEWDVLVPTHGVLPDVFVSLQVEGAPARITLPGVLEDVAPKGVTP